MKNKNDFEEKVRKWMDLEKKIEDLGKKENAEWLTPWKENSKNLLLCMLESDLKDFRHLVEHGLEFVKLERELIALVSDRGVIDHLSDPQARASVLRLIGKSREEIDEKLTEDPLEMDDETADRAWDLVYDLIGTPKELLLNMRRVSAIVALAEIPQRIRELFEEAQVCYVTDQQNAVMALGRMILEHAVTDIGVRLKLFPEPDTVDDFYREYPPYDRADRVLGKGGNRRQQFRDLYRTGSRTIHSSRDLEQAGTADYLEEVIKFIGEVYTVNHHQLRNS